MSCSVCGGGQKCQQQGFPKPKVNTTSTGTGFTVNPPTLTPAIIEARRQAQLQAKKLRNHFPQNRY